MAHRADAVGRRLQCLVRRDAWDAHLARLCSLLEIVVPAGEHIIPDAREANACRQPLGALQPLDVVEMGGRLKVEVTDRPLQRQNPPCRVRRRRGKAIRLSPSGKYILLEPSGMQTSVAPDFSSRLWRLYGRNAGSPAPPVQSRTGRFPASGSSVVLASAVQSPAFRPTRSDVEPP
jgi:hypothetical protein